MQVKQKALSIVWVDEAGRGSWAGPVYAAAFVVLDARATRRPWWKELADSKILSKQTRARLSDELHTAKDAALVDFVIASSSAAEIDTFGIKEANRMAMLRALQELQLRKRIDQKTLAIDGNDRYAFPELDLTSDTILEYIIRGDATVKSISAASILAKVARDTYMVALAKTNGFYGFESHKWYGTKEHAEKLAIFWPSRDHRASYAPIKNLLSTPKDLYFPG